MNIGGKMNVSYCKYVAIVMLFIFDILSAQYYFDPYYVRPRSSRRGSSALGSQGYLVDQPSYEDLLKAYIQAYTQNMQNGIKRLNTEPQTAGRIFRSFL